jgi:hypothetical protein
VNPSAALAELVALERHVGFVLGLWPPDGLGEGDRTAVVAPMVARLAGEDPAVLHRRWTASAEAVAAALADRPTGPFDWFGTPVDTAGLIERRAGAVTALLHAAGVDER